MFSSRCAGSQHENKFTFVQRKWPFFADTVWEKRKTNKIDSVALYSRSQWFYWVNGQYSLAEVQSLLVAYIQFELIKFISIDIRSLTLSDVIRSNSHGNVPNKDTNHVLFYLRNASLGSLWFFNVHNCWICFMVATIAWIPAIQHGTERRTQFRLHWLQHFYFNKILLGLSHIENPLIESIFLAISFRQLLSHGSQEEWWTWSSIFCDDFYENEIFVMVFLLKLGPKGLLLNVIWGSTQRVYARGTCVVLHGIWHTHTNSLVHEKPIQMYARKIWPTK